uniref:Uncharacterized protein n=1 Tax=Periophthalmus magnuspinnatus TaxID=409849 RepID=A0A3B4AAU3_9GOBI
MEANNHFNYGSHSSANSGLKLSSGESPYTNGSSTSFPQQGKNLNGELNVNGISTVVGSGVSGSQQQTASYPHLSNLHQSSRGYEYLWGGHPQYGPLGSPHGHQKQPSPSLGQPHYQSRGQYQLNGRIEGSHQPPGVGPPNMPISAGQYWNSSSQHLNFSSHNLYGQQHYGLMPNGMPYYQHPPSQPQNQAQILPSVGQSYTPPHGSSLTVSSPSVRSPLSTKDSVSPQRPSRDRSPDTNKAGASTVLQVHTDGDKTSSDTERPSLKNNDDQPKEAASHIEDYSPNSEILTVQSSDIPSPKKEPAAKVPPETSFPTAAALSSLQHSLSPKPAVQSSAESTSKQVTPSQMSPSLTDSLTHSSAPFPSVLAGRIEMADEATANMSLDSSNTVTGSSPGRSFFSSMLQQTKGTSGSQVKRRVASEEQVQFPLQHGWRREIRVRKVDNRLRGETWYYTPCGRRMKQFPEIIKKLLRCVQTFFGHKLPEQNVRLFVFQGVKWELLANEEVPSTIMAITGRRGRPPNPDKEKRKSTDGPPRRPGRPPKPKMIDFLSKADAKLLTQLEAKGKSEYYILKTGLPFGVLGARSKAKALAKAQAEAEAAAQAAQAAKRAAERRALAQKRLEERRRQQMIAEELKKPAEDMCLVDHKPLPELSRIPGVVLSGSSFAHCLSAVEFLHAYGKLLGLNIPKDIPSLATLQEGLLGLGDSQGELQDLLIKLLEVALQDPGLPSHYQSVKILGDKLVDVELTRSTVSEVLRIFIEAHGYDPEVCDTLRTKTFQALPPDTKASILGFVVDALNGSNIVTNDIDNTLENMSNYRKNKWIIEGKLRRLKVELARRTGRSEEELCYEDRRRSARVAEEETSCLEHTGRGRRKRHKEDPTNASVPELERQIDKLTKRQVFFRKKLLQSSQSMRAILLGQDRFRRRYIALPNLGMVLVEVLVAEVPPQAAQALSPDEDPLPGTASLMSQPRGRGRPRKIKPEVELHLRTAKIRRRRRSSARSGGEEGPVPLSPPQNCPLNYPSVTYRVHRHLLPRSVHLQSLYLFSLHTTNVSLSLSFQSDLQSNSLPVPDPESCPPLDLVPTELEAVAPSDPPSSPLAPAPSPRPAPVSAAGELEPHSAADCPPILESCPPAPPAPKTTSALHTPGRPGRRRRRGSRGSSPARRGARGAAARRRGRPPTAVFQELEQQYFTQMVVRPIPISMVRGWWWIKTPEELYSTLQALHPRGVRERVLHKHLAKHMESLSEMCTRPTNGEESIFLLEALQQPWLVQERAMESDLSALKWVEELEQRVVTADLHLRPYTVPEPDSTRDDLQYYEHDADPKDDWTIRTKKEWSGLPRIPTHPLDLAVLRLTNLERNIERRYLKEPLWNPSEVIRLAPLTPTPGEEQPMDVFSLENEITSRLRTWRQALDRCRSAPQVCLCLLQLEKAIAWERSVTKVNCQVCRKGDNDDCLLLCDGCDRGCHMYCLRPKMTQVPEGDWFCPTCNVESEPNSRSCKKRTRVKKRRYEDDSSEDEATVRRSVGMATRHKEPAPNQASPRPSTETAGAKRRRMVTRNQPDLTFCEIILMEMEAHADAWPFLEPVNPRLVPGYRRIIKNPMDFLTMRERLLQGGYCSCEDFAADAQLVFNNCELFNEDTSEVGIAGHSMRKFFESRWAEFYSNKDK